MPTRPLKSVDLPVFGLPTSATRRMVEESTVQWPSGKANRLHQDLQRTIAPQTELAPGHAEDARVAGPEHLDSGAAHNSELFQPMGALGVAGNAADDGRMSCRELMDGDSVVDHGWAGRRRGRRGRDITD